VTKRRKKEERNRRRRVKKRSTRQKPDGDAEWTRTASSGPFLRHGWPRRAFKKPPSQAKTKMKTLLFLGLKVYTKKEAVVAAVVAFGASQRMRTRMKWEDEEEAEMMEMRMKMTEQSAQHWFCPFQYAISP